MNKFIAALVASAVFCSPVLADCVLRQSDAIELQLGPFVDSTDGFTAETALTISQADVRLSKCAAAGDCGAWAQASESTSAAHGENGWYEKDFDTTDTNTVGILMIAVNESGALPVFKECLVVETAVYDALYADAVASISVNVATITDGAVAAADFAAGAIDASAIATDAIGAAEIAASAIGASELAADAITSSEIADDAIDSGALAADSVGASEVASNAIGAAEIADGAIDEATFATTAGSFDALGIIDQGTAQSATSTTLVLRAAVAFADDELNGAEILITGGTGVGQTRLITDYVSSTDTATVANWTTTPSGTILYEVMTDTATGGSVSIGAGGITASSFAAGAIDASAVATDAIGAAEIAADAIGASELAANSITSSEVADDSIDAGAIANASIDAATYAAGAIDAAAIAADAIGASELATDAIGAAEVATDAIGAAEIAAAAIAAAEVADGAIDEATFATTAGSFEPLGIVDQGTAQSATGTTLVLRAAAAFADDELIGAKLFITGGTTGVGQTRTITDYVLSTDTATVSTWTTTPTGTITYMVVSDPPGAGGSVSIAAGGISASSFASGAIDAAAIAADAIGASELATDAIGAAELAADSIGASELAADSIGSSELATSAIASAEIASGALTDAKFDTSAGAFYAQGVVDQGTAQSATSTTLVLRSAAAFADDEILGATCLVTGGSAGVGQSRTVTDYVGSTDTATVATWTTTPSGTITYKCFGTAAGSSGTVSIAAGGITASSFASGAIDAAAIASDAIGAAEIASGAIDSGAFAAGAIDASAVAADAIGSSEIATDAIGAAELATDAIGSAELATDAIGATEIASDAIGAAEVAADAIGSSELANNGITANEIALGAITAAAIATDAIGAAEIADGALDQGAFSTTAGSFYPLQIVDQGTAQAATGTTLQLRSAATFSDSELVGATILITGGSAGVGQSKIVTSYAGASDTATVPTWTTTPSGTVTYVVFGTPAGVGGSVSIAAGGITASSFATGAIDATAIAADAIGASEVAADAIGAAEVANGAIDSSAFATDAINSTVLAADAIGSSEIAAGAIGSGEIATNAIDADALSSDVGADITWNPAWDIEVQSEVDDALRALSLNQLLAETYNPAAEPASDSLFGDLTESDGGVTRFNTNALELSPGGGSGGDSAETIAEAVWEFFVEGSVTAQCAMAIQMAEAAGNYTTANNVRTFYARDGTTARVVGTMSSNGQTRSATTITCP